MNRIKVFLSHASEDKDVVLEIYKELINQNIQPWLDKKDLEIGQKWNLIIPKVIRESDYVMVFLSEISISKRGYVQKEFKLVLEELDNIPEGRIFVLPIKLDNCEVPLIFQKFHWININEEGALQKIIDTMFKHMSMLKQGPSSLESARYSLGKELINAKKKLDELEHSLLEIPKEVLDRYASYLSKPKTGMIKLLWREKYQEITGRKNAASWYSFSSCSHNVHNEADIALEMSIDKNDDKQVLLDLSFHGISYGYFLDISEVNDLRNITRDYKSILNEQKSFVWEYFWKYKVPTLTVDARLEQLKFSSDRVYINEQRLSSKFQIEEKNVLLARIINDRHSNSIVLIMVVEILEDCVIIFYQVLAEFEPILYKGNEPNLDQLEAMYNNWLESNN